MTILELTKLDGGKIFVNLELVICFEFSDILPTRLTLCTGAILEVKEKQAAFQKYLPK